MPNVLPRILCDSYNRNYHREGEAPSNGGWRGMIMYLVIAVADVSCRDEELEGILLSIVTLKLCVLLNLLHALLAVAERL